MAGTVDNAGGRASLAATAAPDPAARERGGWRPSLLGIAVTAVGFLVTAALATTAAIANGRNEDRLLQLQTRQTGTLLQAYIQGLETPLASAAEIASSGNGASAGYQRYAKSFLHTRSRFDSVTLWRVHNGRVERIWTSNSEPKINTGSAQFSRFLIDATRVEKVGVVGQLSGSKPRLGYAYSSIGSPVRYVVYAEDQLPSPYRGPPTKGSPFADLRYALYLGRNQDPRNLIATSEKTLPLRGRTAHTIVAFGTASLTLVAAPVGSLGGTLAGKRSWIIALLGVLISLAAGFATDRLVQRRRAAESLAARIDTLLREQRTIAETLQRALLPQRMPAIPGVEIGIRYLPGVNGIEIGGDWYDVIAVDGTRFFFAVGDVSGRGLEAGSVMASLHYAIRAFVSEGHDAAGVLTRLGSILSLARDQHFATVLCGYADIADRRVTIANAGHLPPLIVAGPGDGANRFVTTGTGPPIGVVNGTVYEPVTFTMDERCVLLAYTDGLVERRGETLDDGLDRLRSCASAPDGDLEAFLSDIIGRLGADGSSDDTALLALRWTGVRT